MARIKWLNHPSDKTKNGTVEHVAREFATVACGYGQAEPVRDPRRGTNEFLAMRSEEERQRRPNPLDTCVPNQWPPVWEVIQLPRTDKPCIIYRAGSEVTRFESLYWYESVANDKNGNHRDPIRHDLIPATCPPSIVRHFKELEAAQSPEAIAAANERAAQAKINAEIHEKKADRSLMSRFGLTATK
jgi:hypothetical protein